MANGARSIAASGATTSGATKGGATTMMAPGRRRMRNAAVRIAEIGYSIGAVHGDRKPRRPIRSRSNPSLVAIVALRWLTGIHAMTAPAARRDAGTHRL